MSGSEHGLAPVNTLLLLLLLLLLSDGHMQS
jgi:hypothetical protein